ncbi:MAG: acyl-CoA dehydrogenase family protein [Chitinophagales bacterium]|nr:acyl-CoA dehydrogenase family protein [Chitinophagales bacterium]
MENTYLNEEHHIFRKSLRDFLDKEVVPHIDEWEESGMLPKSIFKKFGEMGYFGISQEEKYGGMNLDFWYDVIFIEEVSKCNSGGFGASISAHPYLSMSHLKYEGSDYLKDKYLPKAISGEWHGCLAITEPHAGSDVAGIKTTAILQGDHYIINGSKCFITNGVSADYMIVACKTQPEKGASGISMIVVDGNTPGITRTNLKKLGWKASDTAEIAFDNVKVPATNLLGVENQGFYYIMQRFELERLTLALGALSAAEYAQEYTLQYMNERKAFGRNINKFQVLRHKMAQLYAEITVVKNYTYQICQRYNQQQYCVKEASIAKLLATELSDKVMYQCLQMFGGYGYMEEYKMARLFRDSRLGTIGGGSSEIMLEIIAKMVIDDVSYGQQTMVNSQQTHNAIDGGQWTVDQIFATLPERLKTEKAKGKNLLIEFRFDSTTYFIIIEDGKINIENSADHRPSTVDCLVETDEATYIAVETGKLNPQEAFMSGKIKVSDLGKMMEFSTLFRKMI